MPCTPLRICEFTDYVISRVHIHLCLLDSTEFDQGGRPDTMVLLCLRVWYRSTLDSVLVWLLDSWLDHVVCTGTSNRNILSCSILDDLAFSDRIPLKTIYSYSCDVDINSVPPNESTCNTFPSVNWNSATDAQLSEYIPLTDILLSSTNINMDSFACNDEQCCNADHHSDIDSLYMHIVNSLFSSGIRIFGANERNHHRTVPGWNKKVAELHATARSCYVRWRICGNPPHGLEYDDMLSVIRRTMGTLFFPQCL